MGKQKESFRVSWGTYKRINGYLLWIYKDKDKTRKNFMFPHWAIVFFWITKTKGKISKLNNQLKTTTNDYHINWHNYKVLQLFEIFPAIGRKEDFVLFCVTHGGKICNQMAGEWRRMWVGVSWQQSFFLSFLQRFVCTHFQFQVRWFLLFCWLWSLSPSGGFFWVSMAFVKPTNPAECWRACNKRLMKH